jgi:transcriptional regulator with XRE-family HTH domain
MPRHRPAPRGRLGNSLSRALDACGLTPQEAAAAARVHKGTLYKILGGLTRNPHHSTLRRLCKVLQIDIAHLIGAEQLELLKGDAESSAMLSEIEKLLVLELRSFSREYLREATEIALRSLLDVKLGMGRGAGKIYSQRILPSRVSLRGAELLVVRQLREVPPLVRPAAVRSAMGALVDFRLIQGAQPSVELFRSINLLRHKLWLGVERPKRKRSIRIQPKVLRRQVRRGDQTITRKLSSGSK